MLRILIGGLLIIILAACSGGSSGGGDTDPGTPIVANTLFPIDMSYTWFYNSDATGVYFTDPRNIIGYQAHPLVHPTGAREYYATDASAVYYLGIFLPTILVDTGGGGVLQFQADTTLNAPITYFSDQWTAPYFQSISGQGNAYITPTYGNRPVSYSGSVQYTGVENITVPNGNYDAHHVIINVAVTATVDGLTINLPFSTELWLAEGYGIVRRNESGTLLNLTGVDNLPVM